MLQSRLPVLLMAGLSFLVIGVVLLLIVLGNKPVVAGDFILSPSHADSAGLATDSSFTLTSSTALSTKKVKEILSVSPPIDVTVAEGNGGKEFTITPTGTLQEDTVYHFAIARGEAADRNYDWAWQTKASFAVLGSSPRDHATTVPTTTTINFTLNRESFHSPEIFFSISPEVEGSFTQNHEQLTFVPDQPLQPATVYTVTLIKGLGIEGSDDQLSKDFTSQFEIESATRQTYTHQISEELWQIAPGREPIFRLYVASEFAGQPIESKVVKFGSDTAFQAAWKTSHLTDRAWTSEGNPRIDIDKETSVFAGQLSVEKQQDVDLLRVPKVLEPGYYLLQTALASQIRQTWFIVTPIASYLAEGDTETVVWLKDLASGQGVNATLTSGDTTFGQTNAQGLLTFTNPSTPIAEDFFTATIGSKQWLIPREGGYYSGELYISADHDWWQTITLNKTIYQPSDTLQFWALLKPRTGSDLGKEPLTVEFGPTNWSWDGLPQRPAFATTSVISSEFGTVSGSLPYTDIAPGYYELRFKRGDKVIAGRGVEVSAAHKPTYQLTLTPDHIAVVSGEPVSLSVEAKFFDGTPVAGLTLKPEGKADRFNVQYLTLDNQGRGQLTYTPANVASSWTYDTVTLAPAVAEESDLQATTTLAVFPGYVGFANNSEYDGQGMNLRLTLHQLNLTAVGTDPGALGGNELYLGEKLPDQTVTVQIDQVRYDKVQTGTTYDPISQTAIPVYNYNQIIIPVRTDQLVTNQDGRIEQRVNVPAEQSYRIRTTATDRVGRQTVLEQSAYGGTSNSSATQTSNVQLNRLDEGNSALIGDEIQVGFMDEAKTILPDGENRYLFLRTSQGHQTALIQTSALFTDQFKADDIPNYWIGGVWWNGDRFEAVYPENISFDEEQRRLTINVSKNAEAYRPGETVKLALSVADRDGKGHETEVLAGALDAASFALNPEDIDPLTEVYSDVSRGVVETSSHRSALESGVEGGCLRAGTLIRFADGSERAIEEIRVGDQVLTVDPNQPGKTLTVSVQAVRPYRTNSGYLRLNHILEVTANHPIFLNGTWQPAALAKVGDRLFTASGPEMVTSIETFAARTNVYNLEVNPPHTYLAADYLVHNAEKGGGGVRDNFEDVATWQTITTNNRGKGTVTFKLPDSITSWRVGLVAATKDLFIGKKIEFLPVTLPFFVDASLNTTYLAGDDVTLRLRVFGTNISAEPVIYTIKNSALTETLTGTGGSSFDIHLGQLPVGRQTLDISAVQGDQKDTIRRTIDVVGSAIIAPTNTSVSATVGPVATPAGVGRTEVTITDTSRSQLLPELRRLAGLSGSRLDQVLVAQAAQQTLASIFKAETDLMSVDLGAYQADGLRLFPYSEPDLSLSARVALLKTWPSSLDRGQLASYLRNQLTNDVANRSRRIQVLTGLAALGEPALQGLQYMATSKDLTVNESIWLGLGLAAAGDKEGARTFVSKHLTNELLKQGNLIKVRDLKDVELEQTTTALMAVLAADLALPASQGLARYAYTQFPTKTLTTLEQVLVAERLLANLPDSTGSIKLSVGGQTISNDFTSGEPLTLSAEDRDGKLFVIQTVTGSLGITLERWENQTADNLSTTRDLGIKRRYTVSGVETNTVHEGDLVRVELTPTFGNKAPTGAYGVVDFLPAGLRPTTTQVIDEDQYTAHVLSPATLVNGRALFAFTGPLSANQQLVYYARVISKGTYQVDPSLIYTGELFSDGSSSLIGLGEAQTLTIE